MKTQKYLQELLPEFYDWLDVHFDVDTILKDAKAFLKEGKKHYELKTSVTAQELADAYTEKYGPFYDN